MVWSKNFHFKLFLGQTRKERERESTRERKKREPRSRLRRHRRTPSSSPTIALVSLITTPRQSHRVARSRLRSCLRSISPSIWPPLDLASAQSRLRPRAFNPPIFDPLISLYDFDFCCCCGGVVVVFWWLWLLIARVCYYWLNWSFGGVWCWDLAVICFVDWDLAVILKFFVIKLVWMLRK